MQKTQNTSPSQKNITEHVLPDIYMHWPLGMLSPGGDRHRKVHTSFCPMMVVVNAIFMPLQRPHPTINHSVVSNRPIASWLSSDIVVEAVFASISDEKSDTMSGIQGMKGAKFLLLWALLSQSNTTTHQYYVKDWWDIAKNAQECLSGSKKASMAMFCHGRQGNGITKSWFFQRLNVGFWQFERHCIRH